MLFSHPEARQRSLREVTAAVDYFPRVNEVLEALGSVTDTVRAVEFLEEATLRMGAEVALFVSFTYDKYQGKSYRLLLACDPRWCIEYKQIWYSADPWLNYAWAHSEPVRAFEISADSPQQQSTVQLAERFGFRSTVIVPAPAGGGLTRRGVLCLGSSTPGYFEGEGYTAFKVIARSVAMELHEWWFAHLKRELIARARLSAFDLKLLTLQRLGYSTKAIARSLGSSIAAIDSRFVRISSRLDVPTRKAAAHLAAEYGVIGAEVAPYKSSK